MIILIYIIDIIIGLCNLFLFDNCVGNKHNPILYKSVPAEDMTIFVGKTSFGLNSSFIVNKSKDLLSSNSNNFSKTSHKLKYLDFYVGIGLRK